MLLHAQLDEPLDPDAIAARLADTVAAHPHLGAAPAVRTIGPTTLAEFADRPYADAEPLLRVALGADPAQLLLAVHHGATDGLGLLWVLGAALGTPLTSGARGIGDRPATTAFVTSLVRRLAEALFTPPAHIAPRGGAAALTGDVLVHEHLPALRTGTPEVIAAAAKATEHWNAEHRSHGRRSVTEHRNRGRTATASLVQRRIPRSNGGRTVVGVGVSRRDGRRLSPIADSAFVRLRLPADPTPDAVRQLLAQTPPEPTIPRSTRGRPWLPIRVLASRLGATFLASNLGVVHPGAPLRSLAFYPTASGRSGVSVGAATVGDTTTITVRARRAAFDHPATTHLLTAITTALPPS